MKFQRNFWTWHSELDYWEDHIAKTATKANNTRAFLQSMSKRHNSKMLYYARTSDCGICWHGLGPTCPKTHRLCGKGVLLDLFIHGFVALPISLQQTVSTTTRTQATFFIPYCRTATLRHSFFPDTARLWNNLPMEVVTAPSLEWAWSHSSLDSTAA